MIKYRIKYIWRKVLKDKTFSFINLSGLSIAISIFLIIMLYVSHELSFDKHYKNKDRIYRLELSDSDPWMASGDGHLLYTNVPEIEKYTRFKYWNDIVISNNSNNANERKKVKIDYLAIADSSVCDIFNFNFIEGNPTEALTKPFSIVLTKSVAKKLFGNKPSYNNVVKIGDKGIEYTVKGVIADLQEPTHLNFQAIASFVTLEKVWKNQNNVLNNFISCQFSTYVLLPEQHNKSIVENKISKIAKEEVEDYGDYKGLVYQLTNLKDIYLNSQPVYGDKTNNGDFVYVLLIVAILILVVACINYINLKTSKSIDSFTEIGIKKVIGAKNKDISIQIISESIMFYISALFVGIVLSYLLIPYFNNLLESSIQLNILFQARYFFPVIFGILLIGIISGLYPSFHFNKAKVANVLKNMPEKRNQKFHLRQVLTICQFSISIVLIISTVLIKKQMNFMHNKELGFNNEHILTFDINNINKTSFKHELLKYPNISSITYSNALPGEITNWEGMEFNNIQGDMPVFSVEPGFLEMYQMKIIKGRSFDTDIVSDKQKTCIINEAAVKFFELKNPIGEVCDHSNSEYSSFPKGDIKVIGVVKDFNYSTLHEPLGPLVFNWHTGWSHKANVKISSHNISQTINHIKDEWQKRSDKEFTYQFADETFDRQYKTDEKFGSLLNSASFFSIIISCLGILGLTIFTIQKRIKEIGIRRVNGAKVGEVMVMLNKDFIKWVALAFVIASPIAYYTMSKWLENFAYKTQLSWWIFALAGFIALFIALATVSWQSWKAATKNPVDALRYE